MAVRLLAGFMWLSISLGGGLLFTRLWTLLRRTLSTYVAKPRRMKCMGRVARIPPLSACIIKSGCHFAFYWSAKTLISFTFLWSWHPCEGRDRPVMLASLWGTWQACDVVFIDLQCPLCIGTVSFAVKCASFRFLDQRYLSLLCIV
jgi:hypothetical protein